MVRIEYRIHEKSCIRDLSQEKSVNKKQCVAKNIVDSSTFKVDLKVLHNGFFLQLLCFVFFFKKTVDCVKKRGLKENLASVFRLSHRSIVSVRVTSWPHALTINGGTHRVLALNFKF